MLAPMVIGFLLAPLWPAYAEAVSRGDTTWAVVAFRRSVRMALLAGTATSIVLLLMGKPLIQLWVGSSIQPSTGLLVAAGVWAVLTCISTAYAVFLNGVGVLRLQVVLAVLMMIANLALSIAFTIRIGVPGVIWGSVVAQAVFVLLPLTVYLARSFPRLDSGQTG
jgi:O-antigen/teichoic acid export membrane protein